MNNQVTVAAKVQSKLSIGSNVVFSSGVLSVSQQRTDESELGEKSEHR